MIVFIAAWYAVGFYAALSNMERVPRIFPLTGRRGFGGQGFVTLMLGPIGLALVLIHGGKVRFWR